MPDTTGWQQLGYNDTAAPLAPPDVAKGGSWQHSLMQFTLQTNLPYIQPQAWLGFRCACTVYIEPKK